MTQHHQFEVPLSVFTTLGSKQKQIYYGVGTTRTGLPGPYLPPELIDPPLSSGDTVACKVPIPPGVKLVGWNAQFTNQNLMFSADGGPEYSWEPPIYPVGHNPNTMPAPTVANPAYREAVVHMRVTTSTTEFILFTVAWTLADDGAAMYEAWITAGKPSDPAPITQPPNQIERMLSLADRSGVVRALQKITGIQDTGVLGDAAVNAGLDVAMLEFMRLAEAGK